VSYRSASMFQPIYIYIGNCLYLVSAITQYDLFSVPHSAHFIGNIIMALNFWKHYDVDIFIMFTFYVISVVRMRANECNAPTEY